MPRLLTLLEDEWTLMVTSPAEDDRHFHATDLLLTALGRIPAPDEIAQVVLFLASDQSSAVTGHVLDCNAGQWM